MKIVFFHLNFTEVCSQGPNQQLSTTVLDNGLVYDEHEHHVFDYGMAIKFKIFISM